MVGTPAGEAAFAEFSLRPGDGLPMRESAQPACQPAAGGEPSLRYASAFVARAICVVPASTVDKAGRCA